ncbi:MAG: hypothetical protein QXN21_06440 [Candidatus Bathyarchaeia archaeon]
MVTLSIVLTLFWDAFMLLLPRIALCTQNVSNLIPASSLFSVLNTGRSTAEDKRIKTIIENSKAFRSYLEDRLIEKLKCIEELLMKIGCSHP